MAAGAVVVYGLGRAGEGLTFICNRLHHDEQALHLQRCYDTLAVRPGATRAEIKMAYRHVVLVSHPDRGGQAAEFQRFDEAYRTLLAVVD